MADGNNNVIEWWKRMAHWAVGIMTCSEYSKSEIVNKLGISEEKVTVAYWGISREKFYKETNKITKSKLTKLGITFPYFVSISCAHPRKNIRNLLKAYRQFNQSHVEHRMVLVWSNPPQDILKEYAKEIAEKRIIFLKYVSDEDLLSLYNGATCTMFPTRAEGFGFPILESFASGTPIMTCRNSCIEEIGKDVAIYVGEDNIDEMVDVMKLFENDSYNFIEFCEKSQSLIDRFSWSDTADKYIKFYQRYL